MVIRISRSSFSEVFCKRGVLKCFEKFTGKNLCWSLFFDKAAGHQPALLLKKRLQHSYFPVTFEKFLRTPFFRTNPVAASELIRSDTRSSSNYSFFRKSFLIYNRPYERKTCCIADFVWRILLCSCSIKAGTKELHYVLSFI